MYDACNIVADNYDYDDDDYNGDKASKRINLNSSMQCTR